MKKTGKVRKGIPHDLRRQKQLAKLLAEDGGRTPIGKLMRRAGYSDHYANSPKKMRLTLSWKQLMEKNLPDDLLSKKHNELLTAVSIDHYVFPNAVSDKQIKAIINQVPGCKLLKVQRNASWARAYFAVPDNRSRKDAIDMAYKLKGKYQPEKHDLGELVIKTVTYKPQGKNG